MATSETTASVGPIGRRVETDPDAVSATLGMPAFLAPPKGAPAYHGFPLLEGSEVDGFTFGVITNASGEEPVSWGDAYVIAPNGVRAGIVWTATGDPPPVVCEPSSGRWGVYAFRFAHPVRSNDDLIKNLHECLPILKRYFNEAQRTHPESTAGPNRATE